MGTDLPLYLLSLYLPFLSQDTLDFSQQVMLFNYILETYSVSLEQNVEVTEIMGKPLDLTSGQAVYTKLTIE